jgi:hypothetical protein
MEQWQIDLITNPPKSASMYSKEEWEDIVKNELLKDGGSQFRGEKNGNFYGHPQTEETRKKISENHSKYWLGKNGDKHHAYGKARPDNIERMHLLHEARKGVPSWNSGRTDLPKHSDDTKLKMSLAKKGMQQPIMECPHCKKIGKSNAMKRWHFDNCKVK